MKDWILNFLLRIVLGTIGIYVCNILFHNMGVALYIGINLINLLTIGILGISGFGLIFAVSAFALL